MVHDVISIYTVNPARDNILIMFFHNAIVLQNVMHLACSH
jgi:hypothetical protein